MDDPIALVDNGSDVRRRDPDQSDRVLGERQIMVQYHFYPSFASDLRHSQPTRTRLTFPDNRRPSCSPHSLVRHIRKHIQRALDIQPLLLQVVLRRLVLVVTACVELVSACAEECTETFERGENGREEVCRKGADCGRCEAELACGRFVRVSRPRDCVLFQEVK